MGGSKLFGFREHIKPSASGAIALVGLLFTFVLLGCDRRVGVEVGIENANPQTESFSVKVSYGPTGQEVVTSEQRVPRGNDKLWIWLPADIEGVAKVEILALTSRGCSAGTGSGQGVMVDQRASVTVQMGNADRIACPIKIAADGGSDALVTSLPLGIDCGKVCEHFFSESVTLTASPGRYSPFVAWTGCDSVSGTTCVVQDVSAPRTVRASFQDLCVAQGACQEQSPTKANLLSITGRSSSDIWAVGENGTTVHFDGAKWTAVASGKNCTLRSLWQSGTQLWAVGSAGCILLRPLNDVTSTWTDKSLPIGSDLFSIAGLPDESLVWVGGGNLWGTTNRGATWRAASPSVPGITGIVAMTKPMFRALASNGYLHDYDQGTDTWIQAQSGYGGTVIGLQYRGSGELWSLSAGRLLRTTSAILAESECATDDATMGRTLRGLWTGSNQLIWAVGVSGLIMSCPPSGSIPATTYSVAADLRRNLSAVWGNPGDGVYAVGDGGLILRLPRER